MLLALAGLLIIGLSGCAVLADEAKWDRSWSCTIWSVDDPVLTLYKKGNKGKIIYDGEEIETGYWMDGLYRRWGWGSEDGANYQIIMEVGKAGFYDFSNTKKGETEAPDISFVCD